MPIASLGALEEEGALSLASLDGQDDLPPPSAAAFAPPPSAGATATRAAPIDMFAPPDAGDAELAVEIAPDDAAYRARKTTPSSDPLAPSPSTSHGGASHASARAAASSSPPPRRAGPSSSPATASLDAHDGHANRAGSSASIPSAASVPNPSGFATATADVRARPADSSADSAHDLSASDSSHAVASSRAHAVASNRADAIAPNHGDAITSNRADAFGSNRAGAATSNRADAAGGLAHRIAQPRVRLAVGVALAIVLGFVPAHVVASIRERAVYAEVDHQIVMTQASVDEETYAALDGARSTALEHKKSERITIALTALLVWAFAGGALAYVWFRRVPWSRWA